jgi:hypothetical protein
VKHTSRRIAITVLSAALCAFCSSYAAASDVEPTILRIEEDWVAYIRNPNADTCAPQIVNFLSPTGTTIGPYGLIELNHASAPAFHSGGFQVQSWISEMPYHDVRSYEIRKLSLDYDKTSYTVAMEMDGDQLRFTVKNGRSRTWGMFAEDGVSATVPRSNHDLSNYDPQASVNNTTINVGAHRVEMLVQTETRYYSATGLEQTDSTDRVLHRFRELVSYVSLTEYDLNTDDYNIDITE